MYISLARLTAAGREVQITFGSIHEYRYRSRQIFGGAKEFCPNSPNLPEIKSNIIDLQKKLFRSIRAPCFFKSKHVGRHFSSKFQRVCEGSQRFCPDFMGFARIFTKSKFLVMRLHPRLLHQC